MNELGSASAESSPATSTTALKGVGAARAKHLKTLGLESPGDLLEYFPRDYQHELAEGTIASLVANSIQSVRGTIVAVDYVAHRGRPRFEATLEDATGKLALVWFNGGYLRRMIHPGVMVRMRGKVAFFRNMPQMVNPKWQIIDEQTAPIESESFRAIYPATASLTSEVLGKIIQENLDTALLGVREWFTSELLARRSLLGRAQAYRWMHCPSNLGEASRARRRLVYDELMLLQFALAISKRLRGGRISAPVLRIDKLLDQRIRARFPFELTGAQKRSILEIASDLRSGNAMNRLLQGDVGSGKTVVALYAMLVAVANKMQAAILAPTEVLAEQHFLTLSSVLRESAVRIELFTGRTKRQAKASMLKELGAGSIHLAVGTQALIQKDIEFANLGLVVVDEQHKLGVRQRAVLKGKGYEPHYLVMTATPIPRTLALSYFADFDVSTIDELPPGRKPIRTRWLKPAQAAAAFDFAWTEIGKGRQAYVVLPQIDNDGMDDAKSVKKAYEHLSKGPFKGLRLGMIHGQMETDEKQQIMTAFRKHHLDALVATTVIEVGIDVANATVMIIEDADRFGLSQLHQLRGRVGRGSEASHCLLIAEANSETAEQRMRAMTKTNDGFELAELDLRQRGPGDFFGLRQHGLPPLKLADITTEIELLETARHDALEILKSDPNLSTAQNRDLREELVNRFGEHLELAQIG